MASNVVLNRRWIEQTYAKSRARDNCQKWVNDNTQIKTKEEMEEGLLGVLNQLSQEELSRFSKHLAGEAFDVQPVEQNADRIKDTIRNLQGVTKFIDKEGGLVRWHVQF